MRADAHDTGMDRRIHAAVPCAVAHNGILRRVAYSMLTVFNYGMRRKHPEAQVGLCRVLSWEAAVR